MIKFALLITLAFNALLWWYEWKSLILIKKFNYLFCFGAFLWLVSALAMAAAGGQVEQLVVPLLEMDKSVINNKDKFIIIFNKSNSMVMYKPKFRTFFMRELLNNEWWGAGRISIDDLFLVISTYVLKLLLCSLWSYYERILF